MTESQAQNNNSHKQNQGKDPSNSRWQSLILSGKDPIYVQTQGERQALLSAYKRLGMKGTSKETTKGIKLWRIK